MLVSVVAGLAAVAAALPVTMADATRSAGSAVPHSATSVASAAPATSAVSATPVVWSECPAPADGHVVDARMRCATLRLPLDYRTPTGRTIDIMISRIVTSKPGSHRGILLANPGGPGLSGLYLPEQFADREAMPPEMLDQYDMVGFDARGVGRSTPVTCGLPDDTPDLWLPYPAADGSIERNVEYAKRAADGCARHSGALLPYLTSANIARDMDAVRASLGEPKIAYFGFSTGTYFGAVYTSLFPQYSDRIVLEGAVDPTLWSNVWQVWGEATELRFADIAGWVAERDGQYHMGSTAALVRLRYLDLTDGLDRSPLALAGGRSLTGNLLRELTRGLLYNHEDTFPMIADAWRAAAGGRATGGDSAAVNTALNSYLAARAVPADVPSDNVTAAMFSIICGDAEWRHDTDWYARRVRSDRQRYPLTAGMPGNLWPCAYWRYRPVEPLVKLLDKGPRNILVLQNRRDPAAPWRSALQMRRALGERATMVSVDGGTHAVLFMNSCSDAIWRSFIVSGRLPATDQSCAAGVPAHAEDHVHPAHNRFGRGRQYGDRLNDEYGDLETPWPQS